MVVRFNTSRMRFLCSGTEETQGGDVANERSNNCEEAKAGRARHRKASQRINANFVTLFPCSSDGRVVCCIRRECIVCFHTPNKGRMKPGGLERVRIGRETRQSILDRQFKRLRLRLRSARSFHSQRKRR